MKNQWNSPLKISPPKEGVESEHYTEDEPYTPLVGVVVDVVETTHVLYMEDLEDVVNTCHNLYVGHLGVDDMGVIPKIA